MKNLFKNKVVLLIMVLLTIAVWVLPNIAATSATVTVTNTPQFVSISNAPSTYNFNATGAAHAGVLPSTTYYSNPLGQTTSPSATVAAGECPFTVTDASSVAVDITNNMSDMSGGSDNSTNGNTGTAGTTTYGAYTYLSGVLFSSKTVLKSSASVVAISSLSASGTQLWGIQLSEQTNAWTGATAATMTLTMTAAAH
jgi:uncharacterized membrane protein YbhN (UPF0104 family)